MKLYISTTRTKSVAAYSTAAEGASVGGTRSEMNGKNSQSNVFGRRLYHRAAILPVVLLFGLVLPLLFIRTAFLVLESAAICSSSIGCMTLTIFGGSDAALMKDKLLEQYVDMFYVSKLDLKASAIISRLSVFILRSVLG